MTLSYGTPSTEEGVTASVATEAADVIAVTLQLVAADGTTVVARAATVFCKLYDAAMLDAVAASWTMAETGAGEGVSTTAKPALQLTLSAAGGVAVVSVTDVAGGSGATVYLETRVYDANGKPGPTILTALTFD